ncbi:MAG: hypothetical protein ACXQTS_01350 [Candidatus Methanospirareceae archaeon]
MISVKILTAGNMIVPCIGCKRECDPVTCELLRQWLENLIEEYREKQR